jgi:hypothetical protein
MNDKHILELVAKNPKISASELAVHVHAELRDVSAALRTLVDVGDLVKSIRFGEQGRQCQVYELSDEFRKSRAGKDLLVRLGNDADPAPAPPIAVEKPEEAAVVERKEAVVSHTPARDLTKVAKALAYLKQHGSATNEQLAEAMGNPTSAQVANYIAGPRGRGEIVRDGELWKLATLKPLEGVTHVHSEVTPMPEPLQTAFAKAAAASTAALTELRKPEPMPSAPVIAAPPKTERAYSCAVWLSGGVEIRKAGGRVVITQAELAEIVAFAAERRVA